MVKKFLHENKGDVVQYIVVLAVIMIILSFAAPKIKNTLKNSTTKTSSNVDVALNGNGSGSGTYTYPTTGSGGSTGGTGSTGPITPTAKKQQVVQFDMGTPLSDYQVRVPLPASTFDYSLTDGKDLRFYDQNGSVLNHWVEEWNESGTSYVWVKVPTIGTNRLTLEYGISGASDYSDGKRTFDFFDGFDGTNIDSSLWTLTPSSIYSVRNGVLSLSSGSMKTSSLPFKFQDGYMAQSKVKIVSSTEDYYSGTFPAITSGVSNGYTCGGNSCGDATILYMRQRDAYNGYGHTGFRAWIGDGSQTSYNVMSEQVATSADNTWYKTAVGVDNSNVKFYQNSTNVYSTTSVSWKKNLTNLTLGSFSGGYDIQPVTYDYVFVRKYKAFSDPVATLR